MYVHHPNVTESYFSHKAVKAQKSAEKTPNDFKILVKACSLMTMYHYGFTMEKAEKLIEDDYVLGKEKFNTAQKGFSKAYAFGESALQMKYPGYTNWYNGSQPDRPKFSLEDVPLLYWTGAALGGAISSSRGDPKWVIQLPGVGKYFETAISITPNWNKGALYSAMISYTMSRSDLGPSADKTAYEYLDKANEASGGFHAGANLTFAETVLVKSQNKDAFLEKVNSVLNNEENRDVASVLVKERAKWLLSRTEDLFY